MYLYAEIILRKMYLGQLMLPEPFKEKKNQVWSHFKNCRSTSGRYNTDKTAAYVRFAEVNREIKMFEVNSQLMYEKLNLNYSIPI